MLCYANIIIRMLPFYDDDGMKNEWGGREETHRPFSILQID